MAASDDGPNAPVDEFFALLAFFERHGLATGRPPTVPPVVGVHHEYRFYVMETIEAPNMRELLKRGASERAGALAAEWLHVTKDLAPNLGPAIGGRALVPLIGEWGTEANAPPGLADALARKAPECARPTLRHGRFSAYHVFDLGAGPAVLDWDTFGHGPIELDAANFLTRLERVSGRRDEAATAARQFRTDIAPLVDDATLAWHEAALHVRGAAVLVRRRSENWEARARDLLGRAADLIKS
jgi:hypothetical protein